MYFFNMVFYRTIFLQIEFLHMFTERQKDFKNKLHQGITKKKKKLGFAESTLL